MRQRIVLAAGIAATLSVAGNAWAGNGQTFSSSLAPTPAPTLGSIVTGSGGALTSFTVNASTGAVTSAGGNAIRVKGSASVTPAVETLKCQAGSGNGNDCAGYKSIAITITATTSSGGRAGSITAFTVGQVSGAGAPTSVTSSAGSLSFTLPASGSNFGASQTVSFAIGLSVQFANSGTGLGALTSVPYTVHYTWQ